MYYIWKRPVYRKTKSAAWSVYATVQSFSMTVYPDAIPNKINRPVLHVVDLILLRFKLLFYSSNYRSTNGNNIYYDIIRMAISFKSVITAVYLHGEVVVSQIMYL